MKRLKPKVKILSFLLVLLMAIQFSSPTITALNAEASNPGTAGSGNITSLSSGNVLPDVENDSWIIPEKTSNPYNVSINLNDTILPVYTTEVYNKLRDLGYTHDLYWTGGGVRSRNCTASISMFYTHKKEQWSWPNHGVPHTNVQFNNDYDKIPENNFSGYVQLGMYNEYDSVISVRIDSSDPWINQLNYQHLSLKLGAKVTSGSGFIEAYHSASGTTEQLDYEHLVYNAVYELGSAEKSGAGLFEATVPLYVDSSHLVHSVPAGTTGMYEVKDVLAVFGIKGKSKMEDMYIAVVDDTSPSIANIEAKNDGGDLQVILQFNEPIRFASDEVGEDLNDLWIDVELQVVGTEHKQITRLYLNSVNGKNMTFKGDLGVFGMLDYTVNDIVDANLTRRDYKMTYGTVDYQAYINKRKPQNSIHAATVYNTTYNTTAVTDMAGNPINIETAVNWQINKTEIKNDATFVRSIKVISSKTALGDTPTSAPETWADDIDRSVYFFGSGDEITLRLSLNRILTKEELESFKIKLNIKDENGEYIWLSPSGSGSYKLNNQEFMYLDMTFTLKQSMTAEPAEGESVPYVRVVEATFERVSSPALNTALPPTEGGLYIDLLPPNVTATSKSVEKPSLVNDRYYTLDVEMKISDKDTSGVILSGIEGSTAHIYVSADVNEETLIKFVVNDSILPPESESEYVNQGYIAPDGRLCLTVEGDKLKPYPLRENQTVYAHILIPKKDNLLVNEFQFYFDACDKVGNSALSDEGAKIKYHIDTQPPELTASTPEITYTASAAVATVRVDVEDAGNKVERIMYQWVERGQEYDDNAWESAPITPGQTVSTSIEKSFEALDGSATYDMQLYVKAADSKGNETDVKTVYAYINIDKPTTRYDSGEWSVSTHPDLEVYSPKTSSEDKTGYTRVTLTPQDPTGDWAYVTVVSGDNVLDVFALTEDHGNKWYKVKISGAMYTEVLEVNGTDATFDDLKNYYGNVKVGFENAYMSLVPSEGSVNDGVTDGSYIADQNYVTVGFLSQNGTTSGVHTVDFGKVTDRNGNILAENADAGNPAVLFVTASPGENPMAGTVIDFSVTNKIISEWSVMDVDFEKSTVELYRKNDSGEEDELIYRRGFAIALTQQFIIPNSFDSELETGMYYVKVNVVSVSGANDSSASLNLVLDKSTPENAGLYGYSHNLRYENGAYRSRYDGEEPISSFGIAVSPGVESMRNSVFAVYTGGVTGFSFTLEADNTKTVYDGITVGGVVGFRYWNSLSDPSPEDLETLEFERDSEYDGEKVSLIVTSGVNSIYTEETIPKGAEGLGDIYLVEGVNTIYYQIKMENGYISPVKQFTIIVTTYTPEFNVAVSDYTASHTAAQRDGQINVHDITVQIKEAFSINGSGNVNVELWSNYSMAVNGEMVEQTEENSLTRALTVLKTGLVSGDKVTLTEDSYTTCFPPYSGQGNYCSAVLVAIDEYGGMVVVAPQIGAFDRLNDPSDPYDDLWSVDYEGGYQDDPFVIGSDITLRTQYNQPVYFGAELVRFENLFSYNNGDFEVIETSIPELRYNLFAISTNNVSFTGGSDTYSHTETGWMFENSSEGQDIINYDLIHWSYTTISFYNEDGTPIAENLSVFEPGINPAGYTGASYGDNFYYPDTGEYFTAFSLGLTKRQATADKSEGFDEDRVFFKISGINIYGMPFESYGAIPVRYVDYSQLTETMTYHGIELLLPFESVEYGRSINTGIFENGEYSWELTDYFGNKHTITHTVTGCTDSGTTINYSTLSNTHEDVTITISREKEPVYVNITDHDLMTVEGNGTTSVTVTVTDNVKFSYKYLDSSGKQVTQLLEVTNVIDPAPYVSADADLDVYLTDEDGTTYRYGSVTVTLEDDYYELIDVYTGSAPTYTFYPGGPTSYTFSKDDIVAVIGDAEIPLTESITFELGIKELREVPGEDTEDVSTHKASSPNVQLQAYKEDRGFYYDAELSLILMPAGNSSAIPPEDVAGYAQMRYYSSRVNADAFLEELGWATSYRFVVNVELDEASRVFIKEGLYPEIPDYETGISDTVDGVTLNGRLLTVEKNAGFTLIVVTRNGSYAAVAFNVDNIGQAPKPSIVKVPTSDGTVKAYVLPPDNDGVEGFTVKPADVELDVYFDESGDYAGIPYVVYDENDEYIISYTYTFEGAEVHGSLNTSIYEIKERIFEQTGALTWSDNMLWESTRNAVSATASFNEVISSFEIIGEIDGDTVTVSASGKQIRVVFTDNHKAFSIKCISESGDAITVSVDAVTNIDREAPVVSIIGRELSQDGKTVTITLATDERAIFREGGYIGEEKDGVYIYSRIITENGSYTYHFVDMGGTETSYTLEIDEIITDDLELLFSMTKSDEDAVSDPSKLAVDPGDTVYVKPSRDASININDTGAVNVNANEWLEFKIADDLGGQSPYVTATDVYGRVVIRQFSQVIPKDTTAPVVLVVKPSITVVAGTERAEIEKLLRDNVAAVDEDPDLTYKITFTEDTTVSGVTSAKYTVTDSNGNVGEAECKLRIVTEAEPVVHVNDRQVDRDGTYYAKEGESITLTVDVGGQPYTVYMESGVKTVSQAKIGSTDVTDGYVTDETVEIGTRSKGFYTVIIQTQSRDYFRIIVYYY